MEFSNAVSTEPIELRPGQYKFSVKFCQIVKDSPAPSKKENIIENDGKLSKKFRMLLMNTFDAFDLDDSGVINREKFQLFNMLSGGGEVEDSEWNMLMTKFETRENGIPLKSFIEMHQAEADSYTDKTLPDMWVSIQELGYNQQFFFTKV
uniref:EF-hand domain-containing protein n=1 Tax=Acrobeloides nanus TaxID=290746 RepID=A0A914CZC5_9BILA